jgi:hypothetical protein
MTQEYDSATLLDMIFNFLKASGLEPEYKGFRIKVDGKYVNVEGDL